MFIEINRDVESSGPKGLVKSDVLAHIQKKGLRPIKPQEAKQAKKADIPAPAKARKTHVRNFPTLSEGVKVKHSMFSLFRSGYTDHPLSSMRTVIAKRLSQSKQTSPHGHCTARADIGAIQAIRRDYVDAGIKVRFCLC